MKKKYITITLSAFLFFAGFTNIQAQDTPFLQFGGKPGQDTVVTKKTTMWSKLTQTPWIVQFGPDIVDDDDSRLKEFKVFDDRNYYPIHASAEKRIMKGLSIQFVLSSTTLRPHDFWSTDLNAKYSLLTKSIEDTKWFDPYALLGGGHTYRDFPHGQHKGINHDNSGNLNIGGGVNIWAFKNAGIYLQSVAKFVLLEKKYDGTNYLQFSAGIVFKIGGDKVAKVVEEVKVVPSTYKRSKEAEDAAKYLRDILNK
ncbi:MAG: hypothetical protein Q7W13_06215 [Bacteroidia bacterium]|nr:hypothetical protein [Bacteroidia bacterium]